MKLAIPMKDDEVATWRERIAASDRNIEKRLEEWREQQGKYVGQGLPLDTDETVAPNKDMPRVKQKTAQLFYQVPKVHLSPRKPQFAGSVSVFSAVLNHKLTKEIHAEKPVDEVLTDILAVSGIGAVKCGYSVATTDVEMPLVDEQTAQALVEAGGEVPTEKVPVPVHEEYFMRRISPAKLVLPPEFTGTDFNLASYVGFKFRKTWAAAKRDYKLDDDHETLATKRDEKLVTDAAFTSPTERSEAEVECTELWYRAHLFDPKEVHPLRVRRLVLVDGVDKPVVHDDSPYQVFDEQGKLIIGHKHFPIKVLTLTTIPDEAIPPSDTRVASPIVKEIHEGRTQMVKQRRRALPMRWYNTSLLDEETAEKIARGEIQDMIPTTAPGDQAIGEIARANYPRETFEFMRVAEMDLQEVWALGTSQLGIDSPGEVTATESNNIQTNSNVRLDYERNKVLRWFLECAECVGDLLQMFADDADYIEVVGEDYQRTLQEWDKTTIAGEFVYDAKTNSQLRLDVGQERMDARNAYQLLANEPFANRQKLVEWVATTHDIDPAQFLVQPPPKQPDPPSISFRFGGDDMNPANPSFPIVMAVLKLGGYEIPPEAIAIAQDQAMKMTAVGMAASVAQQETERETEHGGPAKQASPLSKKQAGDGDYR